VALLAWFSSGSSADTSTRKEPVMQTYVEIQVQSPADGTGFVAQWYVGGERSGPAFAVFTTSELRFFAACTTAPLIVPDQATRTMLRERGVDARCAVGA
jgi:hypothetical protein